MNGRTPTKAESEHMGKVAELGCIVCRLFLSIESPAEIHHTDGSKKEGAHFKTLGLCFAHHRSGFSTENIISRHPYKKAFEKRYKTESELLEITKGLL